MNTQMTSLCLAVGIATSACAGASHPYRHLTATSHDQKLAAYEKYAPAAGLDELKTSKVSALKLKGGKMINDVERLRPLVAEDSATAKHIEEVTAARRRSDTFSLWGWSAVTAGSTALVGTTLATQMVDTYSLNIEAVVGVAGAGLLTVIAGTLIALVGPSVEADNIKTASQNAFQTYEEDLLQNLGLCRTAGKVTPCQTQLTQTTR